MASAASVSKIPYRDAADGISLTTTMVPTGLGRTPGEQVENLVGLLDAFFDATGYHANVNVLNRETLVDAMEHPEKYPSLTIRVSGYAVNFVRLTREQQLEVIQSYFSHVLTTMELKSSHPEVPLIGSPFDLRLSLSEKIGEMDIRSALESGEWGFVHSFQTGSGVDGPGVRIVAWLSGCQFRCIFCHNPDTWKLTNGMPVPLSQAVEVVRPVSSQSSDNERRPDHQRG